MVMCGYWSRWIVWWMKGNIFVTDKVLQESLDKLIVESKLTLNELKNLMKVLGK